MVGARLARRSRAKSSAFQLVIAAAAPSSVVRTVGFLPTSLKKPSAARAAASMAGRPATNGARMGNGTSGSGRAGIGPTGRAEGAFC